ncbi:Quinol monooxygenase YgiN [Seinonella peptonophila]|uniref:Quinol monooxygenase YgiN n=1 Tax=Seinonella peptonophila TaxID=112248 RepID=A0A1M5AAV8_9BACL|nr:putative quinol monooxygenase [Seinonella peptonophila]SHF27450.1 Quinol monooxygenase YgiN [Seinonella peptonophila]
MNTHFGMYVKFTSHKGKRDLLVKELLTAAKNLQSIEGCLLYIINSSSSDENTVWVTEVWESPEAHKASLLLEESKAAIERAKNLIISVESIELSTIGGKGL